MCINWSKKKFVSEKGKLYWYNSLYFQPQYCSQSKGGVIDKLFCKFTLPNRNLKFSHVQKRLLHFFLYLLRLLRREILCTYYRVFSPILEIIIYTTNQMLKDIRMWYMADLQQEQSHFFFISCFKVDIFVCLAGLSSLIRTI